MLPKPLTMDPENLSTHHHMVVYGDDVVAHVQSRTFVSCCLVDKNSSWYTIGDMVRFGTVSKSTFSFSFTYLSHDFGHCENAVDQTGEGDALEHVKWAFKISRFCLRWMSCLTKSWSGSRLFKATFSRKQLLNATEILPFSSSLCRSQYSIMRLLMSLSLVSFWNGKCLLNQFLQPI